MTEIEMFKVGDVVRLTCNTQLMTIERIDVEHGTVHTIWINGTDGTMETAVVIAGVLQPA